MKKLNEISIKPVTGCKLHNFLATLSWFIFSLALLSVVARILS